MLSGEFNHAIDPKNRLFIPAKHREELGDSFMVAVSLREKCLKVFSHAEWENYIAPITRLKRSESEAALRALHRTALQASPDSQGRIILTPALIAFAGIEKNAVIVGCGKYAEIWSEAEYDAHVAAEDLDAVRKMLEGYGL